jgi:hypothetical protein
MSFHLSSFSRAARPHANGFRRQQCTTLLARLCNVIRENGNLVKPGHYLPSLSCHFSELHYRRVAGADRRHRLIALSRFDDTPRELVAELNADRSDYLSHGSFADEEFASQWQVLEGVLRQVERKLTRGDIRARWPSAERPDRATLYRWLRRAVERGLLRQDGLGKYQHPFRY